VNDVTYLQYYVRVVDGIVINFTLSVKQTSNTIPPNKIIKMKIIVSEPVTGKMFELDAYKVDTPTGPGWSVMLPTGAKVLLKHCNGRWEINTSMDDLFAQAICNEIMQSLEEGELDMNSGNRYAPIFFHPKRPRLSKHLLL